MVVTNVAWTDTLSRRDASRIKKFKKKAFDAKSMSFEKVETRRQGSSLILFSLDPTTLPHPSSRRPLPPYSPEDELRCKCADRRL